jgi:hypothetical protein
LHAHSTAQRCLDLERRNAPRLDIEAAVVVPEAQNYAVDNAEPWRKAIGIHEYVDRQRSSGGRAVHADVDPASAILPRADRQAVVGTRIGEMLRAIRAGKRRLRAGNELERANIDVSVCGAVVAEDLGISNQQQLIVASRETNRIFDIGAIQGDRPRNVVAAPMANGTVLCEDPVLKDLQLRRRKKLAVGLGVDTPNEGDGPSIPLRVGH